MNTSKTISVQQGFAHFRPNAFCYYFYFDAQRLQTLEAAFDRVC